MIPNCKFKFLFLIALISLASCKEKVNDNTIEHSVDSVSILDDTLFGELSAKQQYYQHFILEVPMDYQENLDSLVNWVVENEPGGLSFKNWDLDSVSRVKRKLDTLNIIQPLYYVNYFDYLSLPKYAYWDASEKNREIIWTKVFANDRIGVVDLCNGNEFTEEYKDWIGKWKAESGVSIVSNNYQDENIKRDFFPFLNVLKNSNDFVQLELTYFDTVMLERFRDANDFKGCFVVEVERNAINGQVDGGADFILLKSIENQFNLPPYADWKLDTDDQLAFENSTKRVLKIKSNLVGGELAKGVQDQVQSVRLNLMYRSGALLRNESGKIPLELGAKIYCDSKIKINQKIIKENNFKIKKKQIEGSVADIKGVDGTKIVIVSDTASSVLLTEFSELTEEDDVIVCFSNPTFYQSLKEVPNLVYYTKGIESDYDYSILLQQLTGQLAFSGNLVLQDTIIDGIVTDKVRLARTQPELVGMSADTLKMINAAVNGAIGGMAFPGCQVLIAKEGCIVYDKSFGYHTYSKSKRVTSESIYDLASLTKVVSTTIVGMKLYEQEAYKLLDSLGGYLPDSLKDHLKYPSTIRNLTFQELFIHKSGMPSGFPIIKYMQYTTDEIGRFDKYFCDIADSVYSTEVADNFYLELCYQDSMWLKLNQIWLDPSKEYRYSDVNMNTLYFLFKSIVQSNPSEFGYQLSGDEIKTRNLYVEFLYDKFYKSLGMKHTVYKPLKHFNKNQIVPTENERFWRKQLLQGHVHDPNAALYGGVGGNAGVFSTTNDLAILAQMLLNNGKYNSEQYLEASTINKFTNAQPNSHRGLGFNKPSLNTSAFGCADSAPVETYGHTGFTGTCIWVDPINKLTYVFLSNRVHPKVNTRIYQYGIRGNAHQLAYDAILFK